MNPTDADLVFQHAIPENGCFGCGPTNTGGLRLESRWRGDESVATWSPEPWHCAGPPHVLNGGIIATLLDCHTICTAVADAYRQEGRAAGTGELIWYVTARLDVRYERPTPMDAPVELVARVVERVGKKTRLEAELASGEKVCARAEVLAVRVAPEWLAAR